jgi:endonuclease YncB( thermonuclease family)
VGDDAKRTALMAEAAKRDWTSPQLIDQVRAWNATLTIDSGDGSSSATPTAKLLKPNRDTPGVYRVAKIDGALVVDLGFASYFDLPDDTEFKPGDLVSVDGAGRVSTVAGATKADLFTYRVELIKVVDGDTLWVKIYLRPRQWIKQKLRLRGLDCPEMKTPEGKAAKRFVEALAAKTTAVVINTTKADKYDRYLADVFLTTDAGEIFLNNTLLEHGQAVRKDEWEFGDWEPEWLK